MKHFLHFRTNRPSDTAETRGGEVRSLRKRLARFETLEERALLSVTSAEYADIRASYAEFDLPASIDEVNVIEITADKLSLDKLREAVDAAAATAGDDLIVVRTAEGAHNTVAYDSASDEVAVTFNSSEKGALAIVGYGASPLAIDASGMCRALSIGSGATVSLGNITLTGGSSSKSVSNAGYGGGLYNAGRLTASNLSVTGNTSSYAGGGIFNSGTLRLLNSQVTGNSASAEYRAIGGGIYSSGTITAENLLVAENTVSGTVAYGGGVYLWSGRFTADGATITNNDAGEGGGFYLFGSSSRKYALTLTDSTLVENGDDASDEIARYNNTNGTLTGNHVLTDYTTWDSSASMVAYDPEKSIVPGISLTGWNGYNDGQSHTVTLTGSALATDTVVYTYNGKTYSAPPAFTAVGTYTVSATVSREGYNDWIGSATVTIIAKTDITNVALTGWTCNYDGQPHTVTLTDPELATDTVVYTYGGKTYNTPPVFTDAGTYSVTATVSREGYNDWTGSATVTITAQTDIDNVTLTGWSGYYDGQSHTVTLTDPALATDTVVYTYNGETSSAPPAFTAVGTYTVTAKVSRTGYNDWTGSATVTITAKSEIDNVALTGWSGNYDGQSHTVALTDPNLATDTVVYTYNGKTYNAPPTFTEVGTYTVSATVSREGHNNWTGSATVTITAQTDITDVALAGWSGYYDGQSHTVTLTDPALATDTVVYTYNGKTYDTPPVFTAVGTYAVSATVSREGHKDWTGSATVTITAKSEIDNVALTGWSGNYDGQSHTVTLTDPNLATDTVVYTYDGKTSNVPFVFTAVGTYTVSATVSRAGHNDWTGNATVTIAAQTDITNVTLTGWSGYYDGQSHSVTLTDPSSATDTIAYVYNGKTFDTPPAFTEVGTYSVSATVSREGHSDWTGSATVTIIAKPNIDNVSLTGWSGNYDGQSHTVTLTDPDLATDKVVYTYNGQTFDAPPAFTEVGTYTVSATVSRTGYNNWTGSATVTITAQTDIDNVTLTGWSGNYDGQSHTVTLTDPDLATDTVVYTYNGRTFEAPPAFTEVGTYTVSATVKRSGYNDWTGSATVTIIAKPDITNVTLTGWSGNYDGQSHTVTLTDPSSATDTITYTYNGETYNAPPTFTEVGAYLVSATVKRAGYNDWTGSATVTITAQTDIDNVTLTGWSGDYDGQFHTVTLTDPDLATDTVVYTYNGKTFDIPPAFSEVGTYTVSATVSRTGYNDWTGSATVTILPSSTDLVVTTNLDVVDASDGRLSLREAIAQIEAGSTEASRITFSESVFTGGDANRITLALGELTVKKSMTIDAAPLSENVTIDADGKSRVLKVEGEGESAVSLLNLNITGGSISGSPGAGIYLVSGSLSISHTKVTRNIADTGSGGGVYISTGSLTARDSEFSANTAAIGAGVYAAGGTFTAVNCTIAANAATNYGGGIANWGTVSLTNTIVSNNFGCVNNGDWFGLAPENSRNNIIAFDAKFVTAAQFDDEANITNIDELDLSLSSSSWGIDRGLNSAVTETADLAGSARLAQSWAGTATVDIGAYEYQSTFTREVETAGTTVTTSLDLVDDTDGLISLREATLYADEGGTIDFASSLSGETISLSSSALILDKPLTVDASALSEGITLDGNSKTTVMVIGGGTEAAPTVLKGITVTGGKSYDGGGILSTGYLRVVDSVLTANSGLSGPGSGPFGSALFNFRGNVSVSNTTFSKNTIAGAVYSYGGTLTVSGSAFTENSGQRGGAIFLSGGTADITDTTFTGNMGNYGGAIYNNTATLSISGSTITGSGSYYGGAVCNYGILTLTDSIISENNAYLNGGGIYNYRSTLNATNTLFYSNTGGYGGAICNDGAVLTAVNCTLTANDSNFGGGIFANGTASEDDSQTYVITLCNTIVAANTVSQGGSGPDIYRYNENGTISGAFSLSSFTGWTNTAPNYVYHSDERLFRDPDNHDYRLASGGQAIDVGQNAFVADVPKDLDGNTRIVHNVVDLGAYEFQRTLETPSAVVTTQQDIVDAYDGLISLREAILYVENGDVEAESITFDSYLLGKTITLNASLGALAIGETLTIDGSSLRGGVQVDGGGKTGVFSIDGGSTSTPVVLRGLRITGGAAVSGAGITNNGILRIENSLIAGNTAQSHGGGILNRGELTLTNTTVTANIAAAGAGIWSEPLESIYLYETILENTILAGNTLSEGGSGNADVGYADLTGTLMAYNTLSSFSDWTNASDPDASNYVYDGTLPLFADAAQSDYTLADSSQAIDRGQNAYISFSTDLAGNARVVNNVVDLGAYEYLYNADPGDTLDLAKTIAFTDGAFFVREMIGNGLYGDKDVDIYAIDVTDENLSQIFSFAVTASETGEPLGTLIRVFDSEGTLLGTSGETPVLSWTPSETGRFYFAISALANNAYDPASTDGRPSGETGTYNFSVVHAERIPIESIVLSETSASVGQNIAVTVQPQGAPVVYQWVRGTSPDALENIEGATTYYYEVTTADVGCYVGVVVTGYGTAIGTLTALTEEVVPEYEKSLVVTTLSDVADASDGLVSLREAIAYAEEGETVTFDPSLSGGTITLGDYALTITKRISVDASALADGISVSAGGKHRVLMNTAGQLGEAVTLTNLTIRDGIAASGGGILNTGYLALVGSTVTDCAASSYGGGIFNTLAGGASIYTSGYTILTDSVVTACSAGAGGGGIWNEMGIVATQCATITSNNASYGAGIYNYLGSCSADNTLIASNSATYGGGVCIDQGTFFFNGTTITANSAAYGGGVYFFSSSETYPFSAEFDNSIIVGNTATRSGSDFHSEGTGTLIAHNVLSTFTDWTNENAVSFVYDPTLPLFADAGAGDFSLAENSQAIDIGDNSYASHTVDLAGNPRISHAIVDLGAYEYQFSETTPLESVTLSFDTPPAVGTVITAAVLPEEAETSGSVVWTWYRGQSPEEMTLIEGAVTSSYTVTAADQACYIMVKAAGMGSYTGTVSAMTNVVVPPVIDPLVVTTLDDVIDAEDEQISLREAILAANDGDVITFAEDLAGGTITLSADLGELVITKSITVDASAFCDTATLAPRLTVDANAASGQSRRVFTVVGAAEAPLSVSVKGLKITGGRAESIVEGSLSAQAYGGGIYASHANLTLDRCLVMENNVISTADSGTAFATGGGISLAGGSLELINTTVTSNGLSAFSLTGMAETLGGGIHAVGAVTITNSTISSHVASAGGGIYLESGFLALAESSVTGNTCKINSDADDNVAAYGGGIYAAAGSVTVRTSTLRDNMVETKSISGTANAHGGGIYVDTDATLVMEDVVLTGNTADAVTTSSTAIALGGGIFAAGTVTLVDVLVAENIVYADGESAESAGGGIAVYGGALEATGATIASNNASAHSEGTATGAGGGIYVAAGSVILRNTILATNTGTDGNDLFRRSSSTAEGYYTLSSYTDWTNKGAQNFVYDSALPLFAAIYDSDYIPAVDSQVIDIGQNSYAYYTSGEAITVDLSGSKRIVSGIIDLGAYEFQTGELTSLDAPQNFSASAAAVDAITVSWDAVENASGYELAWKLTGADQWQAQSLSALTLTLDGFSTGDVIQLKVRALGDGILYGDSAFSDALEYTLSAHVLSTPPDLDVMRQFGTTVKMMWGASPHASGYELAWKADSWSEWQTEVAQARGMTVDSLPKGETVHFKVRALGDGNLYLNSEFSEAVDVVIESEKTPLDTPQNLSVSAAAVDAITVSWDAVENASGYELAWKLTGADQWQTRSLSALTLTLGGFSTGDVIQLKARALGDGILYDDSDFSATVDFNLVAQVLSTPTGLDVLQQDETSATMSWGRSPNASGYELAWKTDSWSEWRTEVTLARGMTVDSLPTGETVHFKVRALGDGNLYLNSEYSGIVDVVIGSETTQLAPPTILTGTLNYYVSYGANRHQIVWTDVENAVGYTLAYSEDGGATWMTVNADETSRVIAGLTYGAEIRYRVRALGSGNYTDSDWSAVKTFNVCPMDVNGDGEISFSDRSILASAWLTEEGNDAYRYYADINGDGDVTAADYTFIRKNWMKEPGDDDLIYPAPKAAADAIFAEEIDDLLGVDLSDIWD